MKQSLRLFSVVRLAGLLAITIFGLVSIIGTGGGGSGGGYSADFDGVSYYRDADGDGYGDLNDSVRSASLPQGYVSDYTDCDDTDAAISPGEVEICGDEIDNNCNGQINEGCACTDADGDGYYAQSGCGTIVDCVDTNADIHPGAVEICGDGIDNNCDGQVDVNCVCTDMDGDGYYVESGCGAAVDCDDDNAAINPGAVEICGDNIDNDCDGYIDNGCPFLPDTGQTTCYNNAGDVITCPVEGYAFYGQDACYTINPPFYTKLDDRGRELPGDAATWVMIRDNVTGLIWEVKTDDSSIHDKDKRFIRPKAAGGFIDQLNAQQFGSYSDWRIPTKKELISLVNYGNYNGPAIDTSYFPKTMLSHYWTSTKSACSSTYVWIVNFNDGNYLQGYGDNFYYMRAVRGKQSSALLTDNGDGTVTDQNTGLMWTQATADVNGDGFVTGDDRASWRMALSWCENASLAGYNDWRLPTLKELETIVDDDADDPAIDTRYFSDTVPSSYYWTSTTANAGYRDRAWVIDFRCGENSCVDKDNYAYYVRPVRGGQ